MPASYTTKGGITVFRKIESLDYTSALDVPLAGIDNHRGAVFASGYEYPGRYSRWDLAFLNPPLEIISRGRKFEINALNDRGRQLLLIIRSNLARNAHVEKLDFVEKKISKNLEHDTDFWIVPSGEKDGRYWPLRAGRPEVCDSRRRK